MDAWNGGNPPEIVWNCAGFTIPGFFIDTPPEIFKSQMDTNYFTSCFMAHATLRSWLKGSSDKASSSLKSGQAAKVPERHLIFTASTVSFYTIAGYSPYSPAKAAIRSLSDNLSQELQLYNGARAKNPSLGPPADVKVHTIFPGGILTPGFANENLTKPALTHLLEEADKPQTEDEVAAAAVSGLEKGQYLITTAFLGSLQKWASLAGSPRNNVVVDTFMSLVANIAFLFVQPDLDGKVFKWGKEKGMPQGNGR